MKYRTPKPQGKGIVKALGQKGTTGNFAKISKAKGKGAAIGALQNKLAKKQGKPVPYGGKKKREPEKGETKKHEKSESKTFEKKEDKKRLVSSKKVGPVKTQNKLVAPSKKIRKRSASAPSGSKNPFKKLSSDKNAGKAMYSPVLSKSSTQHKLMDGKSLLRKAMGK